MRRSREKGDGFIGPTKSRFIVDLNKMHVFYAAIRISQYITIRAYSYALFRLNNIIGWNEINAFSSRIHLLHL